MSSYTINWIGHVLNPAENHDKIWGYMTTAGGGVYTFWAGRNKPIQFKRMSNRWEAEDVKDKKQSKRKDAYQYRTTEQMSRLWPEFNEHLESCYTMAKLSGKIRTDE